VLSEGVVLSEGLVLSEGIVLSEGLVLSEGGLVLSESGQPNPLNPNDKSLMGEP
jgi:hypothetical protein